MAVPRSSGSAGNPDFLERMFKLSEHGTDVRTEVLAGVTTFVTMAYIIIVNPDILSAAGMDKGAVFMATCVAAAVSTLVMGLYANYPFALAPGMGLNAFFAFVMAGVMGLSWQTALAAVFVSGVLMLIVTVTGLRQLLIKAIPLSLKHAISAGIGLFIALIGLKNAGIVEGFEPTIIHLANLADAKVLLAIIGLFVTGALVARGVRGGMLLGILITTVIGLFPPFSATQFTGFISTPPSIAPTLFALDFNGLAALGIGVVLTVISLFFADLFDTLGTFVGVASRTKLIDKDGNLPRGPKALFADGLGTVVGSLVGTSNVTTYVESASGVAAGGRTGLTATTVGVLFILAMIFSPIALAVPPQATAPALIIVGVLMCSSLTEIEWGKFEVALPAFVVALMMPFAFSIAKGLALGFIVYTVLRLLQGKVGEVHWLMYVLSLFFVYIFATGRAP
jgi:adenine/guanine/hypoxanthine permease